MIVPGKGHLSAPADGTRSGLPAAYLPRKRGDVLEVDLGDGLIIYDRDANLVHHLNPPAAMVWRMCEGESSIDEMVQVIVDVLGSTPHEVKGQVAELLQELDDLDLTEDASTGGPVATREEGVKSPRHEARG